ncbi:MAG: hypothetical protein HOY76_23540, partial [Streptomyces sp.]|nr:hypothetical protein [Streptomyces sp.]
MGRRERPLDPTAGPVARFAHELRKLRQEAGGPTYRAMAGRAHYAAATLAQAAAGERLPSLEVTLAYAAACGADREEWRERWREADQAVRAQASADDEPGAPYLGLARFEAADRDLFFGRDALVDRLAELVRARPFVLLVGPSGCGKSSLLRAGLVPRTRPARVLTPGTHPGTLLSSGVGRGLTIVDQFEEVFTLCADPAERAAFIEGLLAGGPDQRVVVAVRADFLGHCAAYPELVHAVKDSTLLVGPMSPEEMRESITKPAASRGHTVERTLTARIVRELADEPGGLPLMSHVLLQTWLRRRGRTLTEEAYESAGGLHGAVARTAEDLYAELSPPRRQVMRHLLLRLVTPGQGAQDTRRPLRREELTGGDAYDHETAFVLERLAAARLITLSEDAADLAHERLLTAWPRLMSWIEEDRELLGELRRLTEAAATWRELGRDPGALYRGVRLTSARERFAGRRDVLSPLEREFLTAAVQAYERGRRRGRWRKATLAALLVCTLTAALIAWQESRANDRQQREAEARRLAGVAESLRPSEPVTAMRLALAAWHVAELPETRSALLSAMAQKAQDAFTVPGTGTGGMARLSSDGRTVLRVSAGQVTGWDVATHARTSSLPGLGRSESEAPVLRGDAWRLPLLDVRREITLWDLRTGVRAAAPLGTAPDGIETGTSGRSVVGYDAEGDRYRIRLWDTASRLPSLDLSTPRRTRPGTVSTWPFTSESAGLRHARDGRMNMDPAFPDAVTAPDDAHLALCVPGERLQVWDVAAARRTRTPWAPEVSAEQCLNEQVRFTLDGRGLAVIDDTRVRVWDVRSGRRLATVEYPRLRDVGFSADGRFMVATDDSAVLVWRLSSPGQPVFRYALAGERASDLRIDPEAGWIRYLAGPDGEWPGTVRTLSLGRATAAGWRDEYTGWALFSPDASGLVTVPWPPEPAVVRFRLQDTAPGRTGTTVLEASCGTYGVLQPPSCFPLMAFGSDGRSLVYGASGGEASQRLSVVDVATRRPAGVFEVAAVPGQPVASVAYGLGDASLILPSQPAVGSMRVWDVRARLVIDTVPGAWGRRVALRPDGGVVVNSEGHVVTLPSGELTTGPGRTTALAFSGDGTRLAAGDTAGRTALWDGEVRRRLAVLAESGQPGTPAYVSA